MAKAKSETLDAILAMLESESRHKRSAAAIVIEELAPDSEDVLVALRKAAENREDGDLRRNVVNAFGAIQPKSIVKDLIPLVRDPDKRVRRAVKAVLSSSEQVKVPEVAKMMETGDEKQRIAAISVLGAMGDVDARRRLLGQLEGASGRVASAIVDALRPVLDDLEGAELSAAVEDLDKLLTTEGVEKDPDFGLVGVQLLGCTNTYEVGGALVRIAASESEEGVRVAALESMQRLVRGRGHDALFERLIQLAEVEPLPDAVRKAALNVLANLDVPMPLEPRVRQLATHEDVHRRRWAIQALGAIDSARAADTLATVVESGAASDRELALEAGVKTSRGRAGLARLLGRISDSDRARQVAKSLRLVSDTLDSDTKHGLEKSVMEAPPEIGKIILSVLKMGDGSGADRVQENLLDKAVLMKNKRQFEDAIAMLRSLAQGAHGEPEIQFQLGICELKTSKRKIVRGKNNDPCLATLLELLEHKEFPLLDRLMDEKILEPEDLYYVGFSCAERSGVEQSLGGDVLLAVTENMPGTKHAKMAHNKLVTMGWAE